MEDRAYCEFLSKEELIERVSLPPGKHPEDNPDVSELRFLSVGNNTTTTKEWTLGDTLQDAKERLIFGWPEINAVFSGLVNCIRLQSYKDDPKYRDSYSGDEVDIGKYLAGESECFWEGYLDPKYTDSNTIEIVNNFSIPGCLQCGKYYHNATVNNYSGLLNRGAAIYALVDSLERSGKCVGITNVVFVTAGRVDNHRGNLVEEPTGINDVAIAMRVKEPNELMSQDMLAYYLAHPSFLRRIGFRVLETVDSKYRGYSARHDWLKQPDYGLSNPVMCGDKKLMDHKRFHDTGCFERPYIFLDAGKFNSGQFNSIESSLNWLKTLIDSYKKDVEEVSSQTT